MAEACRFKDTAVKDFRNQGMKGTEAKEAVWEAMAEVYPHPVVPDAEESGAVSAVREIHVPEDWGELPTDSAVRQWLH